MFKVLDLFQKIALWYNSRITGENFQSQYFFTHGVDFIRAWMELFVLLSF